MATEVINLANEFNKRYEPKRKFRWILEIDGMDSWVVKSAKRPSGSYDETTLEYVNFKRYIAGKFTPDDISVTCYDPIAPSAMQKLQEWARVQFEPTTGLAGYADMYKKDITLKMLDPLGAVVEKWLLKGAWIRSWSGGDLSYDDQAGVCEIEMTLRVDSFIQEY